MVEIERIYKLYVYRRLDIQRGPIACTKLIQSREGWPELVYDLMVRAYLYKLMLLQEHLFVTHANR